MGQSYAASTQALLWCSHYRFFSGPATFSGVLTTCICAVCTLRSVHIADGISSDLILHNIAVIINQHADEMGLLFKILID